MLAEKFADELKRERAIYLNKVPLLVSIDELHEPKGKIITGYDGFEALRELKINGYFSLHDDGVVIDSRPMMENKESALAQIKSIARRLRKRNEADVPTEPGNCINNAFLPDSSDDEKNHPGELISIGFRFVEFPDSHLSIQIHPSNPHEPERSSLEAQWRRIKEDPATADEGEWLAKIKYFRESPRQIHEWKTGYEVLIRNPDEEGVYSYHDFHVRFTGVPHDPFKPHADIQFQTGIADNAAGATKASLTDEEAIAIWDKITSTIRVRPTSPSPIAAVANTPVPLVPIGELAATGRLCPQTGRWTPDDDELKRGAGSQLIKVGERMPYVVVTTKPTLWQRLRGEQGSHRVSTVWKLVSYDSGPAHAPESAQAEAVAIADPSIIGMKNVDGNVVDVFRSKSDSNKAG